MPDIAEQARALETLTGARISYHDLSGVLIPLLGRQRRAHTHPFCSSVKRAYEGRCMRTDVDRVRSMTDPEGYWKACHAGVWEYVLPIRKYGIVFFGPFSGKRPVCRLTEKKTTGGAHPRPPELIDARSIAVMVSLLAQSIETAVAERMPIADRRRAIERYITERSCTDASVQELADGIGVSVSRTRQLVRAWFGKPFNRVITESRMRRAYHLLASTDAPLKDIARAVGYVDTDYFFKVFRAYSGLTPRTYRTAQRGER